MTPLIILLVSFGLFFGANKVALGGKFTFSQVGRAALSVMLVATGIVHFTSAEPMIQMMPEFLPAKRELVYFTGVCELAAAIGLLWDRMAKVTSLMLIIFFVAIFPANVMGSLKQVQLGGMEYGAVYLIFRVPLQILFIGWAYYFGIRRLKSEL